MKKDLILDLTEDLIDEDQLTQISKKKTKREISNDQVIPSTGSSNIQDLMTKVAKILAIPMDELNEWVKKASLSDELLKAIFRIAKRFKLNPVLGHIAWERNAEGGYEVYIPIDGWIALIHREPRFQGLAFHQSAETENNIPLWMECTIYLSDLTHPVTIREYLVELKTDHPVWQQMPRRMLRYKTLQQCARLAFGISVPEFEKITDKVHLNNLDLSQPKLSLHDPKEFLKHKLSNESLR